MVVDCTYESLGGLIRNINGFVENDTIVSKTSPSIIANVTKHELGSQKWLMNSVGFVLVLFAV
jgi:hypothetical protein